MKIFQKKSAEKSSELGRSASNSADLKEVLSMLGEIQHRMQFDRTPRLEGRSSAESSLISIQSQIQDVLSKAMPAVLGKIDNIGITGSDTLKALQDVFPSVLNSLNSLENSVAVLLMYAKQAAASELRRDQIDLLHQRARAARDRRPDPEATSVNPPDAHDMAEVFHDLECRAPQNFAAWKGLAETALNEYRNRSAADLAVDWHRESFLFREFLAIHAKGRVLDIGVGPLPTPSYLADLSPHRLAGLDPLMPFEPHPFAFANTVAEHIPWSDGSFETVVAATSLDHVYLLDAAMSEVARVLTGGGVFLVWTGLFPETPVYDPYTTALTPADDYHLFHPGENWFLAFLGRWFRLRERIEVAPNNVFLALEKT